MSISLANLTRSYGAARAVDDLSAEIPAGCFFTVLGPSGCGKSTLLRLIAGLEPLDQGRIALEGRAVAGPGLHLPPETRGVGVVFQSYALWPHMDVLGNVAFPIEAAGVRRTAARAEAAAHLDSVALTAFAQRRPADLSGGQRQRVALARCLAARARIVLMDEPLANLDPHLRAAMEEEMAAFHARAGATTLFITHDQREAMALSDLVAVMRAGRFEQIAAPQDLHDRPATAFVAGFIGRGVVLDVTVTEASPNRAKVRLPNGQALEVRATGTARPGMGQVLLRPTDLRAGGDGHPATVLSAAYRGDHWEARVALPGLPPLTVTLPQRVTVAEDLPLALCGGWLLPATAPL
ncbi:MAG: ABC transporter ATP-binding protein [Rhodobacteraceae bacterium]|nr:ABC transporter ATP-binding protein [Paracoccaceae bacterium]